jgi:pimeloyl-ACP methyl ester carboxylesterase
MVKRRIKIHTLFIYGEKDHAVLPLTVKGVKEFIDAPYKEIHMLHSAHWVQQEAKEEVTKALIDFLAE